MNPIDLVSVKCAHVFNNIILFPRVLLLVTSTYILGRQRISSHTNGLSFFTGKINRLALSFT